MATFICAEINLCLVSETSGNKQVSIHFMGQKLSQMSSSNVEVVSLRLQHQKHNFYGFKVSTKHS